MFFFCTAGTVVSAGKHVKPVVLTGGSSSSTPLVLVISAGKETGSRKRGKISRIGQRIVGFGFALDWLTRILRSHWLRALNESYIPQRRTTETSEECCSFTCLFVFFLTWPFYKTDIFFSINSTKFKNNN